MTTRTMEPERIARSNADDAYQAIRRLIVTVEMPPGTAFSENELVRRVGFGKTPVREALLRLKLERLVVVQARSGYRVSAVTLKDVRDTCRLLGYLEADAAQQAAGRPAAGKELAGLCAPVDRGAQAAGTGGSAEAWIRADWQFHLGLARGQDNHVQAEVMTRLGQLVMRFRYLAVALGVPGRMLTHRYDGLLDALERGDPVAARDAVTQGWQEIETRLVSALAATEPVQNTNVWSARDRNAFYLDAVPPGPSIDDVIDPRPAPDTQPGPQLPGSSATP